MEWNKTPYWEICNLKPYNDKFNVTYQDYKELLYIAEISFLTGEWSFVEGIRSEILENDDLRRFKESIPWYTSFVNDTEEHRRFILEFQIGVSTSITDSIEVFYQDENGEWQHEEWSFDKYDGFIEIFSPNIPEGSIYSVKRFKTPETPLNEVVDWVLDDIKKTCKTDKFMFYIKFH